MATPDYTKAQGLLNSGNLQGGYNALRDGGMDDAGITNWYNQTYGDKISAADVTSKFSGGYQAPAVIGSGPSTPAPQPAANPYQTPTPAPSQPLRISPEGKFDINGNPLTIQPGQNLGGLLFANSIMNADGTTTGQQYYDSAADAAYWKNRSSQSANSGAVIGGTPAKAPTTGLLSTPTTGTAGATTQNQFTVPNLNQTVDANTSTIEGRITNLLQQNNPVIRQAGDRARAAFAQRGLLNSSMAEEAAMEAMTTKAIEIAGPDAAAYLKQSQLNQTETNDTAQESAAYERNLNTIATEYGYKNAQNEYQQTQTLQTNYVNAIATVNNNHSTLINTINASDMKPEEKTAAIANANTVRSNSLSLTNASFAKMPGWSKDWMVAETPVATTPNGVVTAPDAPKPGDPTTRLNPTTGQPELWNATTKKWEAVKPAASTTPPFQGNN